MQKKTFPINNADNGKRIDVFLSENLDFSRARIKKLCDDGNVLVNEKPKKAGKTLKEGDLLDIIIPEVENLDLTPCDIPIDIIYQDNDIAVINKPQGLTVHAGNGTRGNTLVNALLFKLDSLSGINGVLRPGIVHRIDKNTSGLLVVAKNDKAHVALSKQLEDKTCYRKYVALLEGVMKTDEGRIETNIGRSDSDRTKMAVVKSGRLAVTDYKVIKRYQDYTLCEFFLKTGRTHQIRVHAKYMNHPVVGDKEYGYKNGRFSSLKGQLLHAEELSFVHPSTGKRVRFFAPIPDYFSEVLSKLKELK